MGITDETLMAFADGALGPDEAATVAQAVAADPALAAKVALFADSRTALQRAHAVLPAVPAALEARVRAMAATDAALRQGSAQTDAPTGNVIDLAARRRVVPFWQLPLAASVALAVGLGSAWFMGKGDASGGLQIAALADPDIAEALGSLASGDEIVLAGGTRLAAIASFRAADGTLCREFEHGGAGAGAVVAVACRTATTWDVRFAIAATPPDATGYAPASSLETLDAFHTATGAGAPLSVAEEAAALQALR